MRIVTGEVAGFGSALKGMRNPMNSWDKGDSVSCRDLQCDGCIGCRYQDDTYEDCQWVDIVVGKNDMDLAKRLIKGGPEHCKFLRQIQVWADMDMPRYWWSEFDTYGFNSKNSCSTMHKLLNNKEPITLDMFAYCSEDMYLLLSIIHRLEEFRKEYIETKDTGLLIRAKRLLPEGFLQLRTVNTNYAELRNIYHQRKHHRLKEEWIEVFCKWVESLPYSQELIIGD